MTTIDDWSPAPTSLNVAPTTKVIDMAAYFERTRVEALLPRWREMDADERMDERDKGEESIYAGLPGWEPEFCLDCQEWIYRDFWDHERHPEGHCGVSSDHYFQLAATASEPDTIQEWAA